MNKLFSKAAALAAAPSSQENSDHGGIPLSAKIFLIILDRSPKIQRALAPVRAPVLW